MAGEGQNDTFSCRNDGEVPQRGVSGHERKRTESERELLQTHNEIQTHILTIYNSSLGLDRRWK